MLRSSLKALVAILPEGERAGAIDGYDDGRVMAAGSKDGASSVICAALKWKSEAQALAFLKVERKISTTKDAAMKTGAIRIESAEYAEGVGVESKVPGFVATKVVRAGGQDIQVVAYIFVAGSLVFEVAMTGPSGVDRAAVDAAVASAAAYVTDPAHPKPTAKPLPK